MFHKHIREIFFCIELDNKNLDLDLDLDFVKHYLSIYFNVHFTDKIQNFHQCIITPDNNDHKIDLLQRGLECLSKMYIRCVCHSECEIWLLYIGTGFINNPSKNYKDITLLLLDKTPYKKECVYTVNRNKLFIDKNIDTKQKLNYIKILCKSLKYLFTIDNTNGRFIKYNNIINDLI